MSKIKPKHAYAKAIFESFGGIPEGSPSSESALSELCNFRILPNGSLEKRCGWYAEITLPDTVRGVWQGTLEGRSLSFAVGGSKVYQIIGTSASEISSLTTSVGRVTFVPYRNRLYLLDGAETYVLQLSPLRFTVAVGYAPLYGRNWHPTDYGQPNEPFNLFSSRLRIHYFNTTSSTTFNLPYYASSIDKVRVDGKTITNFGFSAPSDHFTIPTAGASVEVAFTVSIDSAMGRLMRKCTRAYAESLGGRDTMLLYGSTEGQHLFCALNVDDSMLYSSAACYSDTDPLYVTENTILTLTSPDQPITTLFRDRDRILAFHARGAHSVQLSTESDTVEAYPLLQGVGCTALGLQLSIDGDAVIVNEGGVFRLSAPASDPDAFTLTPLCDGIKPSFLKNTVACNNMQHGELWFRDSKSADSSVWVYQVARKRWYRFSEIAASFFFTLNGFLGFANRNQICLFDEIAYSDNGETIHAVCQTAFLTMGYPEEKKRSLRLSLVANTYGNSMDLEVQSERYTKAYTVVGKSQSEPELFDLRASLGRFRFLRVRFSDSSRARSQIHRFALYANL